jgi:hypothetical protein
MPSTGTTPLVGVVRSWLARGFWVRRPGDRAHAWRPTSLTRLRSRATRSCQEFEYRPARTTSKRPGQNHCPAPGSRAAPFPSRICPAADRPTSRRGPSIRHSKSGDLGGSSSRRIHTRSPLTLSLHPSKKRSPGRGKALVVGVPKSLSDWGVLGRPLTTCHECELLGTVPGVRGATSESGYEALSAVVAVPQRIRLAPGGCPPRA